MIAGHKNIFQQLKKHECPLSSSTSLLWNGWRTMVQKCENDHHFPHLQFQIPINNKSHHYPSHFRLFHVKVKLWTPFWQQSYGIHLEKVNSFILEQMRMIKFCPFDHYGPPPPPPPGKAVKGLDLVLWKTVTTKMTCCRMQHFIRVCTVC